jgi:hypothetical protein
MGSLYSSDLDRIQLNFIKEASRLRGTDVLFFETLSETKDIYTDIDVSSSSTSISVSIILQDYPQNRKTLQRQGWYNKDSEDNPITAYVPLDLEILKRWQKVLIPGRITGKSNHTLYRPYQITKIATTMDHPHYYLVAMAPLFDDASPDPIDMTENSNFINFGDIESV